MGGIVMGMFDAPQQAGSYFDSGDDGPLARLLREATAGAPDGSMSQPNPQNPQNPGQMDPNLLELLRQLMSRGGLDAQPSAPIANPYQNYIEPPPGRR